MCTCTPRFVRTLYVYYICLQDLMGTLFPSILLWLAAAVRGQWPLTTTQDTYVNKNLPLINYGAAPDLRLDSGKNNILFEFDLASLPAARALKCNFRVFHVDGPTGSSSNWNDPMVLYQLTSSFAEGTWDALGNCVSNCTNPCLDGATWIYRADQCSAWRVHGGDYPSTALANASKKPREPRQSADARPFH
eukprot:g41320.t1